MKNFKNIFLVFIAYYLITCFSDAYMLFGPFYALFGASPRITGLFLSLFYFARLFARPLGSWMMERVGARRTLIISACVSIAASACIALLLSSSDYALVLFLRAISGVSDSVFVVATVAYQSMVLDEKSRGFGFALFTTGSMLPTATIVPLSEFLVKEQLNLCYAWLPTAVALLCLLVSFYIKDLPASKREKTWGTYPDMLRIRGVKTMFASCTVLMLADGSMMSMAALAAAKHVPLSYFMVSMSISGLLVRTVLFRFISKLPRFELAAFGSMLLGVILFVISFVSSPTLWITLGFIYGVGIGVAYPTHFAIVGDLLPVKFHPKATGGILLCVDFGWGLSPFFFGLLSPLFGASGTIRFVGAATALAMFAIYKKLWRPLLNDKTIVKA